MEDSGSAARRSSIFLDPYTLSGCRDLADVEHLRCVDGVSDHAMLADLNDATVVGVVGFRSELVHLSQMSELEALTKVLKIVQRLLHVCLDALQGFEFLVRLGLARGRSTRRLVSASFRLSTVSSYSCLRLAHSRP